MKNLFSLFFTMPAKGIFCLSIFLLSLFFSQCSIDYFNLYSADKESFVNVLSQGDAFDYRSSRYFKNTVETTFEDVITLCFEYEEIFDGRKNEEELLSHFGNIGDISFAEISKRLHAKEGFHFALLNHGNQRVYSDIPELNGTASSADVKKYFAGYGKNQLTVHTCHNPYFETDSFISFAEFIRKTAANYEDNFDIYITFSSEEAFDKTEEECMILHYDMFNRIEKLNSTAFIYVAAIFIVSLIMLTVTGKQEPGGKTYPTVINRLPNDLITVLYGIVLMCEVSLYSTTLSMLVAHGNELDAFWFTHSNAFYLTRIRFCVVVFICSLVNLLCILKRQYKMGLLVKNTYIYSIITTLKKIKMGKESRNTD